MGKKNLATLPPIELNGSLKDSILVLLGLDQQDCFLWGQLSDHDLNPNEDYLKFPSPSNLEICWLITKCTGITELSKISEFVKDVLPGFEVEAEVEELDFEKDIDEFDELPMEESLDLQMYPSETNLNSVLESFKTYYCKKIEECEQMHYFVGVGLHVVDGKSYSGIHIFEVYYDMEGPTKLNSISNQIMPFRRLVDYLMK